MACNVKMFFGERLTGNGFEAYLSEPESVFIADFDCTMISTALGMGFTEFELTEKELLSTATFQTWCMYISESNNNNLYGPQVFDALGLDLAELREVTGSFFQDIIDHKNPTSINAHINQLAKEEVAVKMPKLEQAFKWIKNVHDNYYGKTYLIQIGDANSGVCIKDKFGNAPAFDLKAEPGGLYYTSDSPSTAGAWPNPNVNNILGLQIGQETLLFHGSDNRVGSFCRFDEKENITKPGFANLNWRIDLSSIDDGSFVQKNNQLFLSCSIDESIYQIDGDQYVKVEVSGPPKLKLQADGELCEVNLMSQGAVALMALFGDQHPELSTALGDTFCDDPDDTQDGAPTNRSAFNILKSNRPAVVPSHFILPMKSNLFVYGPWSYVSNPVGGTMVDNNQELCPWKFSDGFDDGYDRMNQYGSLIAQDGPRGLQKQESGSITVPSLPSYNLGFMVGTNAATLTDININIGESGYTTTYNFQTYTPKFGEPGRALADLWSKSYQSMSYINKFFKDQAIDLQKLINSTDQELSKKRFFDIPKVNQDGISQEDGGDNTPGSGRSPGLLLIGSFFMRDKEVNASGGPPCADGSFSGFRSCNPCGTPLPQPPLLEPPEPSEGNVLQNRPKTELEKGYTWEHIRKNTFHRVAISTLDLIFTPISTNQEGDDRAQLPRLAMYQDYECSQMEFSDKPENSEPGMPPLSKSRSEIPPFLLDSVLTYDLPVNQQYLNAVTSETMLNNWGNRSSGSTKGFICHLISYGNDFEDFKYSNQDSDEEARQGEENFRYNILKGPLSLQAWGYDTSGKPIPNAIDSAADTEKGMFRRKGLKDKFLYNWLENPKTWPAGPIDLRWDRERGVWVAPPANKIVVARLTQNLSKFGVAEAELVNPTSGEVAFYEYYDMWDVDGRNIKQSINKAKIKIYDYLGIELCKCDTVYAYYDDNRYIVLESSRAYKDPNEACCPTTPLTTEPVSVATPTPTSCWCNLECLQTLKNYKEGEHQALVHKAETNGPDCLLWEDIVECYTPPPNFYEN